MLEDNAIALSVLANDSDPDGSLNFGSLTVVSGPANGNTTVNHATGEITYFPNSNFNGPDSFVYSICDDDDACQTATVSITVIPVYDPLVAVDDPFALANEDLATVIAVLANDINIDGLPLTVTSTTSPFTGTVNINPDQTVTYNPALNFIGTVVFSYVVSDTVTSDTAVVTVTVNPVNDPPVAVDDPGINTIEDTFEVIDVLANDFDPDSPILTIVAAGPAANGTVSFNATSVTYTPFPNFSGTDTFTYTISDGILTDWATVTITVNGVNDPPVAVDDGPISTDQDTPTIIPVYANDTDVDGNLDPTSVTTTTNPVSGTVSINPATGDVTYTPNPGINGTDSFDYQICDTLAFCDTATVTIIINDTTPSAPANLRGAGGDSQILLGWDSNPEADVAFYRIFRDGAFVTTSATASYLDTSVSNTVSYNYHVTAVDLAGNESSNSNTVSVTPNAFGGFPVAAGPCTVTPVSPSTCADIMGPPDGIELKFDGGGEVIVDFGAGTGIIDGPGPDFVFFEFPVPPEILMDFITVQVSDDLGTWYTVFEWDGDAPPGDILGTNIDSYANNGDGELEDELILLSDLYSHSGFDTGITIDLGAVATPPPAGLSYRYVRFTDPGGIPPAAAQVDSVLRLN